MITRGGGGGGGGGGGHATPRNRRSAQCMPDFTRHDLGLNVQAIIPEFNHGTAVNSWQEIDQALKDVAGRRQTMRCVRALCYNLPAKCFARDGARFRNWCTPARNVSRAAQLAAALGMIFTPTSKGYL